jgi:hypothetical protein
MRKIIKVFILLFLISCSVKDNEDGMLINSYSPAELHTEINRSDNR